MTMGKWNWVAGILLGVLSCGCIDATTLVKVNKDGSGQIEETVFMSAAVQQMMESMAQGMMKGLETPGAEKPASMKPMMDPEQYKARASKMGQGVQFVSAKEVSRADGFSGVRVHYTFPDVRKIKVNAGSQDMVNTPGPMGAGSPPPAKEDSPMVFTFTAGPQPQLTVSLPKPPPEATAKDVPEAAPADPATEQQMAMMAPMLAGFRVCVMIEVDGEIIDSNARYVSQNKAGKKNTVTLIDMNIGELAKNPENMKKLQSLGETKDMKVAMRNLQGVAGVKIDDSDKINIRFK